MTSMILCPTRGGQASHPNQDRAIAIAKERGAVLLFLYMTNVQFLNRIASPKVVDIEEELDEMGEFLLLMAQERARKEGVKAYYTVRRGIFKKILHDVIMEHTIETVILGSAVRNTGIVSPDFIIELGDEIYRETGVEVVVLKDGEIEWSSSTANNQKEN